MIENLFVCIGAQKSGTTWLHKILSTDERLSLPKYVKEPHYFSWLDYQDRNLNQWRENRLKRLVDNPEFLDALSKYFSSSKENIKCNQIISELRCCINDVNPAWYEQLFTKKNGICVDITPAYAVMSHRGFMSLKLHAIDINMLFILRDPVERAWSGLLQHLKRKFKNEMIGEYVDSLSDAELVRYLSSSVIYARSNYVKTIDRISQAGLYDRLNLVFYDDLKINPEEFLTNIYRIIGLKIHEISTSDLQNTVHVSPEVAFPERVESIMLEKFRPVVKTLNANYINVPAPWKVKYAV